MKVSRAPKKFKHKKIFFSNSYCYPHSHSCWLPRHRERWDDLDIPFMNAVDGIDRQTEKNTDQATYRLN